VNVERVQRTTHRTAVRTLPSNCRRERAHDHTARGFASTNWWSLPRSFRRPRRTRSIQPARAD